MYVYVCVYIYMYIYNIHFAQSQLSLWTARPNFTQPHLASDIAAAVGIFYHVFAADFALRFCHSTLGEERFQGHGMF